MALTKYVVQPPAGNNLYSYLDQELRKIQRCSDSIIATLNYQEGTWTPVVLGGTTPGVGTYLKQTGYYTRIGNRVFFNFWVGWSAHTGTGVLLMDGLPFPAANKTLNYSANVYGAWNGAPAAGLWVQVSPTLTQLYIVDATGNIPPISTHGDIICAGQYQV